MLTINLEFDANAAAAPQSFRNGVQAAANILEAAIFTPITVNIAVGYGEIDANGPSYTPLVANYSEGGIDTGILVSYAALRAALAANETSPAGVEAIDALPNTLALNGKSNFEIAPALAKALGVIPATGSAIDGVIGFPTSFSGNGLVGTAIVEELHGMGLLNAGGDLGLFSYSSPGMHFLPSGATATTPAYFSVDGGVTDLANYAVASDETLFAGQPNDPLDFPNQGIALTPVDLTEISAVGYDTTSTPVLATPNINPMVTAPGTPASITAQPISVAQNGSVSALSMIASVSAPSGDSIAYYGFYDAGSGNGHLSFNGIVEPDNRWVYVLDTELTALTYVGGSSAGSETIGVEAFDDTAGTYSPASQLTATTTAAVAASTGGQAVYSIAAADAGTGTVTPDGTGGTTPYTFTVSRSGDTSQATTLSYAVGGSGSNPAPVSLFQNPSGTVSLAAGASSAVLTLNAFGMPVATAEGFTVTISGGNGTIGVASASDTVGSNVAPPDPGSVAINAAAVYGFANTGVPSFTSLVNQDGSADLAKGAGALTGGFIGGYVAGIEVRVMANLEQTGGSTAQIDGQFGHDLDTLSALLAPGTAAVGFGFLAGLTTGGPTGLTGGSVPAGLQADIRSALGSDQSAAIALAGGIVGAVNFAQGYVNNINAGQSALAALHGVEAGALV